MFARLLYQFRKLTMTHTEYAKSIGVQFGESCIFNSRDFGSEPYLISIGDNFYCSKNINFVTHDGGINVIRNINHEYSDLDIFGKITIGNNVFIGINCTVLPGTCIKDNVIVGAGSIVRGTLEENSVYAGVPVRKICSLEDWFKKNKHLALRTKHLNHQDKKSKLMGVL